jgi:hypothetical protein
MLLQELKNIDDLGLVALTQANLVDVLASSKGIN